MYLIYDVSAIGNPGNYKAPFSETFNWPRMLHISWIVLNKEYKPIGDFDRIVKPDGFTVTEEIQKKTKIDQEDIDKKAVDISDILKSFNESCAVCDYIFSHNLNFNENVLAAEYIRQSMDIAMFKKERFCLMQESTYYCKISSKTGGYKWPTLNELHCVCFNTSYTPLNNARADVIAAARCFIKLMKGRHLEDLFEED
jgi:DNA polymerase III alpha subunit (gram-positive type)